MDGDQNGYDDGDCWFGEGRYTKYSGQGREVSVIVTEEGDADGIGGSFFNNSGPRSSKRMKKMMAIVE